MMGYLHHRHGQTPQIRAPTPHHYLLALAVKHFHVYHCLQFHACCSISARKARRKEGNFFPPRAAPGGASAAYSRTTSRAQHKTPSCSPQQTSGLQTHFKQISFPDLRLLQSQHPSLISLVPQVPWAGAAGLDHGMGQAHPNHGHTGRVLES